MRKTYPSGISREQFEQVNELLETACKKTRPRPVDLYDIFFAVLYILKSGLPVPTGHKWRMLPSDFPEIPQWHKWVPVHPENGAGLLEQKPVVANFK